VCGLQALNPNPTTDTTVQDALLEEAKQARIREEARQARIRTGINTIDSTFAPFNSNFYNQRKTAFLNYYQPQIDDQFTDAKNDVTYKLARNGTLRSTIAADEAAKLGKKYSLELGSLVSKADSDANNLRSQISGQKSALVSQLNATGDADRATNEALARTQEIYQARPEYSPLGDIFGGIGDAIGNYNDARNNRAIYDAYFGTK